MWRMSTHPRCCCTARMTPTCLLPKPSSISSRSRMWALTRCSCVIHAKVTAWRKSSTRWNPPTDALRGMRNTSHGAAKRELPTCSRRSARSRGGACPTLLGLNGDVRGDGKPPPYIGKAEPRTYETGRATLEIFMPRITLLLLLCAGFVNVPSLAAQRLTEEPLDRWHDLNA